MFDQRYDWALESLTSDAVVGADRIATTDARWPNVGIEVDVVRRS
jgi:hypothetical protein